MLSKSTSNGIRPLRFKNRDPRYIHPTYKRHDISNDSHQIDDDCDISYTKDSQAVGDKETVTPSCIHYNKIFKITKGLETHLTIIHP